MDFRWNEWNEEHIGKHGISPEEAESVVRRARSPFPRIIEDDKRLVWGRGSGGRFLQVVFVLDEDDTVYVIHARPLTDKEKHRYKRIMQ
jgi:uncharacterized protein